MVDREQDAGETRLSADKRKIIEGALSARAIATSRLTTAETNAQWIDALAANVAQQQEGIYDEKEDAQSALREVNGNAKWVLHDILREPDVNVQDFLDTWYRHQPGSPHGDERERKLYEMNRRDRATFAQLTAGVTIIDLKPPRWSGDWTMVDTVATTPVLAAEDGGYDLDLSVVFETVNSRARNNEQRARSGIEASLTGLSQRILVGEDSILRYMAEYEPTLFTDDVSLSSQTGKQLDTKRLISFMSTLKVYDSTEDLYGQIPEKMKQTLMANTRYVAGLTDGGKLGGVDDISLAGELLAGLQLHCPEAYVEFYDTVATAGNLGDYQRDEYTRLLSAVEHRKSKWDLTLEEMTATRARLTERASELKA